MVMSECVLCVRMSVRHGPTLTGSMRATDRTICAPLREWFNDLLTITQRAALSDGSTHPRHYLFVVQMSAAVYIGLSMAPHSTAGARLRRRPVVHSARTS